MRGLVVAEDSGRRRASAAAAGLGGGVEGA